jgi:xyloglucan-specific exo-beta-1,4-glucanase
MMYQRFFYLARLAILLPVSVTLEAAAQLQGGFTQINMQDGGYYPAIIQHWSGRLIGRTDGGGIYLSDNQGYSWTYLCGNMTTPSALIPQGIAVPQTTSSSSNLILQACGVSFRDTDPGRGIWKSTNGGASWTQTLSGVNFSGGDQERVGGECLIFNPTNDLEVWAGSRGQGLYESTNAGDTWGAITTGLGTNIISSLYIPPARPGQIFAGGDGGLWMSPDYGASWVQLAPFTLIQRVTSGPDGTVYFGGINNGQQVIQKITSTNWSNPTSFVYTDLYAAYTSGIGDDGNAIVCLTVMRNGNLVAGDFDGYTRISYNEGGTFTTLPNAYVPGSVVPEWAKTNTVWRPNSLTQDVTATNTWYGGGGYGPMRTDDGGQTWQYICNGIGEVVTYKISFHPTDPNRIYIPCGDHGGAIVTDGGISGNVASMATPFFAWPSDIVMYSHRAMACYTNGVNRVIFPGGCELDDTTRIYETTNDGTGWFHLAAAGLPTNTPGEDIIDNVDSLDNPDDFLVVVGGNLGAGGGGVYRTTDGGASFTQCNWFPATSGVLGLGDEFSWNVSVERDATNVNVRYLYSRAATPGIGTGGGFFISTDRGVNWTLLTPGLSGAIVPGDWSDWNGMIAADHGISGNVWMTITGGTNGLLLSTNSGTTWSIVPGFTSVNVMDALNGNIAVYGEMTTDTWNKIYYSSNNGSSWSEVTQPGYRFGNTFSLALDPHRPGRIFIGTGERSVGIFTPGTPIQQWRLDYFLSCTNAGEGANGADPNSNGIPNLVEYALGSDPLAGTSSDPLGPGSPNGRQYLPYATISTNNAVAGKPVMRVNLPDPPPGDIDLLVQNSTNLTAWNVISSRSGTNAWQWLAPGPNLVVPGVDTNGRAWYDIASPASINSAAQFWQLQFEPIP